WAWYSFWSLGYLVVAAFGVALGVVLSIGLALASAWCALRAYQQLKLTRTGEEPPSWAQQLSRYPSTIVGAAFEAVPRAITLVFRRRKERERDRLAGVMNTVVEPGEEVRTVSRVVIAPHGWKRVSLFASFGLAYFLLFKSGVLTVTTSRLLCHRVG